MTAAVSCRRLVDASRNAAVHSLNPPTVALKNPHSTAALLAFPLLSPPLGFWPRPSSPLMVAPSNSLRVFLTGLVLTASLLGQNRLRVLDGNPGTNTEIVFDAAHGFSIGYDPIDTTTYAWTGSNWLFITDQGPISPAGVRLIFDPVANNVVMVASSTGATWTWDGGAWTQVATTGPGPRIDPALCFDAASGRVLLQGGAAAGFASYFSDTWEWDGAAWTQVATQGPAVARHAMVYDSARANTVLFGGGNGFQATVEQPDTWIWNGQAWALDPAVGPPRSLGVMTYDPVLARTIAVVPTASPLAAEAWSWDGAAWSLVTPVTGTVPILSSLTYDPSFNVVLGMAVRSTHTFDGSAWQLAYQTVITRALRAGLVLDETTGNLLAIGGGTGRTSERRNGQWIEVATDGPSRNSETAVAFDTARGVVVSYGTSTDRQAVWEWSNGAWSLRSTGLAVEPPSRRDAAVAFDPVSNRTILFGGLGIFALNDTWAWDGTAWTQLAVSGPPGRYEHKLVTDTARQRIVMFGGRGGANGDETWEWDGSSWTHVATGGPDPRIDFDMAYDPVRRRVVVFAGEGTFPGPSGLLNDVWEWDGTRWSEVLMENFAPRERTALAFEPDLGRVVVLGGYSVADGSDGLLRVLDIDTVGVGCAGAAGTPQVLLSDGRPLRGTTLDITVTNVPFGVSGVSLLVGLGLQLPAVPLDLIGMPGCVLEVVPAPINVPLGVFGGTATLPLAISLDPALVGLRLVLQAAVPDPGANALGLTLSTAGFAQIR